MGVSGFGANRVYRLITDLVTTYDRDGSSSGEKIEDGPTSKRVVRKGRVDTTSGVASHKSADSTRLIQGIIGLGAACMDLLRVPMNAFAVVKGRAIHRIGPPVDVGFRKKDNI